MDASNRDDFRVRTGLDEVVLRRVPTDPGTPPRFAERTRHARTERIDRASATRGLGEPVPVDIPPQVGHPWDPLTVQARLHRMADAYGYLPQTSDTRPAGYGCGMPMPLPEEWKDTPRITAPVRLPATRAELTAADLVLMLLLALPDEQRIIAWGIACRLSNRRIGRELRCHHLTVAKRKLDVLAALVARLNATLTRPDERDVERARDLIHRNIK